MVALTSPLLNTYVLWLLVHTLVCELILCYSLGLNWTKLRISFFQHSAALLHAHMPVFLFFPSRAIVFVVDSAAFQREVKDVAEFLYQVLLDSIGLKNTPSFLIACNKQGTVMFSGNNSWDFFLGFLLWINSYLQLLLLRMRDNC